MHDGLPYGPFVLNPERIFARAADSTRTAAIVAVSARLRHVAGFTQLPQKSFLREDIVPDMDWRKRH